MKKIIFCLLTLLAFSAPVFSQDSGSPPAADRAVAQPPKIVLSAPEPVGTGETQGFSIENLTKDNLFNELIDPLYSALFIVISYLSAFIPGLKQVANTWLRTFTIALVFGIGFYLWRGDFTKIALSYLFTSGLYVTIFKNIAKTPSPSLAPG